MFCNFCLLLLFALFTFVKSESVCLFGFLKKIETTIIIIIIKSIQYSLSLYHFQRYGFFICCCYCCCFFTVRKNCSVSLLTIFNHQTTSTISIECIFVIFDMFCFKTKIIDVCNENYSAFLSCDFVACVSFCFY